MASACAVLLAATWPVTPQAAVTGTAPVIDQAQGVQGRGTGVIFEPARPTPPPATGTGAISGVVLDSSTQRPIAGALVASFVAPAVGQVPPPRVFTDDLGRFVLPDLPAGSIRVSASHPDFVVGADATTGVFSSTAVSLTDQQWVPDVTLHLHRPSSISGTVFDEHGDPVAGIPVRVLQVVSLGATTYPARAFSGETDDRGMYRAGGLAPGPYIVQVPSVQVTVRGGTLRPPAGTQRALGLAPAADGVSTIVGHFPTTGVAGRVYPMAYHPSSATRTDATPITLGRDDARVGVDVQLRLAPTYRVSGTLTGSPESVASMPVWLSHVGDEASGPGSEVAMTLSGANGDFTFLNVPPGDYTLTASRLQSALTQGGRGATGGFSEVFPERGYAFDRSMSGQFIASAPGIAFSPRGRSGAAGHGQLAVAVVDRDVTSLSVPLTAGVTVSGHFVWDGQAGAPTRAGVPGVWLDPADGTPALGAPQAGFILAEANGAMPFEIPGVLPGRYFVAANESSGLSIALGVPGNYVTRIEWRGRDLAASPLEVTGDEDISGVVIHVSTTPAVVNGTARDEKGQPVSTGAVLFFPPAPAQWDNVGFSAQRFGITTIANGAFSSAHLRPGDYLVAAVPNDDRSRRFDRRFLATLAPRATKVRVEPAVPTTVALTMIGGGR